jgi:hypothetical protein
MIPDTDPHLLLGLGPEFLHNEGHADSAPIFENAEKDLVFPGLPALFCGKRLRALTILRSTVRVLNVVLVAMARLHQMGCPGRFKCQSVARSKIRAVRNSVSSANGAAKSCRPIGSLDLVMPQGILIPGMPARLAVIV